MRRGPKCGALGTCFPVTALDYASLLYKSQPKRPSLLLEGRFMQIACGALSTIKRLNSSWERGILPKLRYKVRGQRPLAVFN